MIQTDSLQKAIERALALAHAAVDEPSDDRIHEAKRQAAEVLPWIGRMHQTRFTLGEANRILQLMGQLRAVLAVVDRRGTPRTQPTN
jgi:hypothetical protein